MSVFDIFPEAIQEGVYWQTDERNPLGVSKGEQTAVSVIIDEGGQTSFLPNAPAQSDDVLIYGQPGSPLASHACVGGYVQVSTDVDKRVYKIERWDVGRDQATGQVDHYEVYGQEVGGSDYSGSTLLASQPRRR